MNKLKRLWYIIIGKHKRYVKLEEEIYQHDGYPQYPTECNAIKVETNKTKRKKI